MQDNLKKAFCGAIYTPEADLSHKISSAILLRQKRMGQMKLGIFSLIGLSSLVGLLPSLFVLAKDFSESGFYEYISLAFSSDTLINYWREISLSLLDSVPVVSIIISLSLILVFCMSIKYIARQISKPRLLLAY